MRRWFSPSANRPASDFSNDRSSIFAMGANRSRRRTGGRQPCARRGACRQRQGTPAVVHSLAADQIEIAAIVLGRSPLFVDTDLIETITSAPEALHEAIAARPALPRAVCAALAETGSAMTCLTLLENAQADIAPASFERIAERHGNYSLIPGVLLARGDLPPTTRPTLVAKVSAMLVD